MKGIKFQCSHFKYNCGIGSANFNLIMIIKCVQTGKYPKFSWTPHNGENTPKNAVMLCVEQK